MSEAILSSVSSLYFVGGVDEDNYRDEILELVDNQWRQVATMRTTRYGHGVTAINDVQDYWPYCK